MIVHSVICRRNQILPTLFSQNAIFFLLMLSTHVVSCSSRSSNKPFDAGTDQNVVEKYANYNSISSNHHPKYQDYLAQAMAYAKVLEHETMPILDEDSLIMKPSGCSKARDDSCKRSLEKAQTLNASSLKFNGFHKQFYPPTPVFHCTTHDGEKSHTQFRTYFRMDLPNYTRIGRAEFPRVFVLEKEVDGEWEAVTLQSYWIFPLNTQKGSTYRVQVTAVAPDYVYEPQLSEPITLYDAGKQTIGQPKNFRVVSTTMDSGAARPGPRMILRWESGSGTNASCDFDVFYMDDEMKTVERTKPDEAFWVKLEKLHLDRNYTLSLIEKFGSGHETKPISIHVTIPSCLELRNYNFNVCSPSTPTNVRIVNETGSSFFIVWDEVKYRNESSHVKEYEIAIDKVPLPHHDMEHSTRLLTIRTPGNETKLEIHNITSQRKIIVAVYSITNGGKSRPGFIEYQLQEIESSWTKNYFAKFWYGIVIGILLLMSIGLVVYLKSFRARLNRNREKKEMWKVKKMDEDVPTQQNEKYTSKYEINFGNLFFGDRVGKGEFGEVRKATLVRGGSELIVAVKTLRVPPEEVAEANGSGDGISAKDIIELRFREEFEILKSIDRHIHVMGLIGIVRDPTPALVVEYCDGGDLLKHLRKASFSLVDKRLSSPCSSMMGSTVQLQPNSDIRVQLQMVTNAAYFSRKEPEIILTPLDLLSYARQIACGMDFISNNKIVHRDLACRNILVSGKNRVLKIADFGLSRDVYEHNSYKKNSKGKIPIKWMAIECLTKDLYTTKSDVWSYGIVLWEIFTFGAKPYIGIENQDLFDKLRNGLRMKKPDNCSDDLYILMRRCWDENPYARPDFNSIRCTLEEMIRQSDEVPYLNLENSNQNSIRYSELAPAVSLSNVYIR